MYSFFVHLFSTKLILEDSTIFLASLLKIPNCNQSVFALILTVSSARSGNTDAAIKSLTNAITANANYKAEATIDLEFSSLRANEAFIALTK